MPTLSRIKKAESQPQSCDPSRVDATVVDFQQADCDNDNDSDNNKTSEIPTAVGEEHAETELSTELQLFEADPEKPRDDPVHEECAGMPPEPSKQRQEAKAEIPANQEHAGISTEAEAFVEDQKQPCADPVEEERTGTRTDVSQEETEDFDPDGLEDGARVVVLGKRGKPWQATIQGRLAQKGEPGFMVQYDGKSLRRGADWVPQVRVVNFIDERGGREPQGGGREEGRREKKAAEKTRGASMKKKMTFDERWEKNYQHLVKFRGEEGHCNVTLNDNKSLGAWVNSQRSMYKRGILNENRAARLESIGFVWKPLEETEEARKNKATKKPEKGGGKLRENQTKKTRASHIWEERWENNYQELLKFREEEGHCNVPLKASGEFKTLGAWVNNQRATYRMQGGVLRGNRVARLESIGFVWRLQGEAGHRTGARTEAATGRTMTDGRETANTRENLEGTKAKERREVISAVDFVFDNPSIEAQDIQSFTKEVWELAQNLARERRHEGRSRKRTRSAA